MHAPHARRMVMRAQRACGSWRGRSGNCRPRLRCAPPRRTSERASKCQMTMSHSQLPNWASSGTGVCGHRPLLGRLLRTMSSAPRIAIILAGAYRTLTDCNDTIARYVVDANPSVAYFCDPVMGDNGKLYVPQELVQIYRDEVRLGSHSGPPQCKRRAPTRRDPARPCCAGPSPAPTRCVRAIGRPTRVSAYSKPVRGQPAGPDAGQVLAATALAPPRSVPSLAVVRPLACRVGGVAIGRP